MEYKHFILTRFNIQIGWTKDKYEKSTQTNKWMEDRYDLFMRYCFPSVAAQTNKGFTWIVMFDENTAEKYKKKNDELKETFPQFAPVYLSSEQAVNLRNYLRELILKQITDNSTYVITTRLDNDDALSINAIQKIRNCVQERGVGTYVISLISGIQYYTKYNVSMMVDYRLNHFISLIENIDSIETVYHRSHVEMDKFYEVAETSKGDISWMEVVHDTNLDNDLHLRWVFKPVQRGFRGEAFGITPPITWCNTLYFKLLVIPYKAIRKIYKRLKEKITI